MVNSQFVFFDESSTAQVSNAFINNSMSDALIIQVDDLDSVSPLVHDITIEASVDQNRPDSFFPIKIIDLKDLDTKDAMAAAGIYAVGITGLNKIRLRAGTGSGVAAVGTFKVYAVSAQ